MPVKFPHQYEILLKKADGDLALVQHVLALVDKPIDAEIIFFHLQQAVEKYLKALICYNGVHFEKVHDIDKLITFCLNNSIDLPDYINVFIELNPYAVEGRYASALSFDTQILALNHVSEDFWVYGIYGR